MKYLISILALFFFYSNLFAGSSCHTDMFGNYVCTYDDGYRTETHTDMFGNDVTTDNFGNRQSCHTDMFGNYVCD